MGAIKDFIIAFAAGLASGLILLSIERNQPPTAPEPQQPALILVRSA